MPTLVEHAINAEMSADNDDHAGPFGRVDGWLNPARGIAIGVALGLVAWTAIGALAWLFVS